MHYWGRSGESYDESGSSNGYVVEKGISVGGGGKTKGDDSTLSILYGKICSWKITYLVAYIFLMINQVFITFLTTGIT